MSSQGETAGNGEVEALNISAISIIFASMEYEKINLEDYFQTGEGGTALTYNLKNGKTLAKLFSSGVAADTAEREFLMNGVVYESGLPTPKPIRLITDGTRFGAEYELIPNKRSFTRIISQEPDKLEPLSRRFAVLARQIHEKPADTEKLPDMRELIRDGILKFEALPAEYRDRMFAFLDNCPAPKTCLHGDLHIGNIITDGQRDLWIDVGDFAWGTPEWDLGMMYYTTHFFTPERADNIFHLDLETLKRHWEAFAPVYYGTDDPDELAAKERSLYPYIALKIAFAIGKLGRNIGSKIDGLLRQFDAFMGK